MIRQRNNETNHVSEFNALRTKNNQFSDLLHEIIQLYIRISKSNKSRGEKYTCYFRTHFISHKLKAEYSDDETRIRWIIVAFSARKNRLSAFSNGRFPPAKNWLAFDNFSNIFGSYTRENTFARIVNRGLYGNDRICKYRSFVAR